MFKRRSSVYVGALIFLALIATLLLAASAVEPVAAESPVLVVGQEVCPEGDGWTKINTSNEPQSVTVNADSGKLIVAVCYKAGDVVNKTDPLSPPVTSYTFNSTVWNKEECESDPNANGCNYQAISHYAYKQQSIQYASATATVVACGDGDETTPVVLSVTGATMTVNPGGHIVTGGATLNLAVGDYTISYQLESGYNDPGNLPQGFKVLDCSKESADASASVGSCTVGTVTEPVTLFVSGATMHVYEGPSGFTPFDHTGTNTYNDLPAGSYKINYTINEGAQDPGGLPTGFTIAACAGKEDAEASASVGACTDDSTSQPVSLSVTGATMNISGPDGFTKSMTGSGTFKDWATGHYSISYTFDENYKDPGNLPTGIDVEACKQDDGFESLRLSVQCVDDPNNLCHKWTVTNPNDVDVEFTWQNSVGDKGEATCPASGSYVFNTSYVAQSMQITFSDGEIDRNVSIDSTTCPLDDDDPDYPAGGQGPNYATIIAPSLLAIAGLSIIWILVSKRFKKTN
ncbi:hypothetical protein KQH56_01115 [bacterium]|nr:hypothetical protein [bacterium]